MFQSYALFPHMTVEAQCACRVVQDYYSDNEEMLAKLAAGASGYDLIVPAGNVVESLIRQNALRPLDKNQLPNLHNIDPAYLDAQKAGRKFRIVSSIPKEGAVLALDSMVLHKSGPRPDPRTPLH